jgi:hypothetical protein
VYSKAIPREIEIIVRPILRGYQRAGPKTTAIEPAAPTKITLAVELDL